MNKWKALAGSLVLGSALTTSGMVLAFPDEHQGHRGHKGHHGGHHKERMFEHLAEKLDLTEGQKAQLKANREASKEARKAQREEWHALRKQLREAIESGADQATLDSLGAELGKLEVQKMQRMHEKQVQFESILTDEQKAKLAEMKAERMERHEKRMQRWQKDEG
ncbi:Spy/CpxP family protein refolding chaperone [Microbulbifer sp. YPW1]|uniref:Spy/CpxP family protein refolding chaperone n=1 Tax=Microbulbifer sp. YPW1 TaxID=2745199 RepID=UPI0015981EF5|nr:Spy/CpxP family protein refolding chaperone [Microbulbifer sp. YPW1]QKX18746.1 Spy/CpxP family protein refolding chaperone [Microbulbifer sp. YPW1]